MNVIQLFGIEGAKKARGLTIIIDIMRAATVEAYAFGQKAKYIIPVSTKEEAFVIKNRRPDVILIGEEYGRKIKGFDFGNSPSEIIKANLKDKTLVQRTSSGTQGLINAISATELIFGSFVTSSAIIRYIRKKEPTDLSIVSLDSEDKIFARFLELSLQGVEVDKEKIRKDLLNDSGIEWFLDPAKPEFSPVDIEYALDFDKFNFLCVVNKKDNQLLTTPVFI